ncbi:VanZ family protein [Oceanobacillus sp. FSL K6-2867]|uniref:VanZ family protein n=1 Tax=Oceanobacillus sp. FSL K6-2867 TaxID=2954748 RepID=UPI0030D8DA20
MMKYLYWLIPISWMSVIFYSSATPYENQDIKPLLGTMVDLSFLESISRPISFTYNQSVISVNTLGVNGFVEFFIRKATHITVFFLLALFFYLAFRKTTNMKQYHCLVYAFLLTVLYAMADEKHQGMTPNRTPYIGDVGLDSLGALLAVLVIVITWQKNKRTDKNVNI